jgi:AraC-like DNA-binding protein
MQTAPGVAAAPAPALVAGRDDGVTVLHEGEPALVEAVRCMGAPREPGPSGFMPRFHFTAPLRGSYVWRSGGQEFFADPACILYAPANEAYTVSHPMGGDCSLVITPRAAALEEILGLDRDRLAEHPRLRRGSRAAEPDLQLLLRRILAIASQDPPPLQLEEMLLELIETLLGAEPSGGAGPAASRAVRAAKAYLHENLAANPSLSEVARAAGLSPCHLTHLFRQAEGMPLYRYQLALRLSLALEALPACEDLTVLALELGFSSHSHFSSMFRARFGVTPSALRAEMTAGALAPPAEASEEALARPARSFRPLCPARGGWRA